MDDRVRCVFRSEARHTRCRVEVALASKRLRSGEGSEEDVRHANALLEQARRHLETTCDVLRKSLSGWAGPATTQPDKAAAFLRLLLKHRSAKERFDLLELARLTDDYVHRIPQQTPSLRSEFLHSEADSGQHGGGGSAETVSPRTPFAPPALGRPSKPFAPPALGSPSNTPIADALAETILDEVLALLGE